MLLYTRIKVKNSSELNYTWQPQTPLNLLVLVGAMVSRWRNNATPRMPQHWQYSQRNRIATHNHSKIFCYPIIMKIKISVNIEPNEFSIICPRPFMF